MDLKQVVCSAPWACGKPEDFDDRGWAIRWIQIGSPEDETSWVTGHRMQYLICRVTEYPTQTPGCSMTFEFCKGLLLVHGVRSTHSFVGFASFTPNNLCSVCCQIFLSLLSLEPRNISGANGICTAGTIAPGWYLKGQVAGPGYARIQ